MAPPPTRAGCRRASLAIGGAVLAWQVVNLATGRFRHEYLVADLVASVVLVAAASARDARRAVEGMRLGLSMFVGILLAATTGKLVVGGAHPGTIAAALGLVACLAVVRRLPRPDDPGSIGSGDA